MGMPVRLRAGNRCANHQSAKRSYEILRLPARGCGGAAKIQIDLCGRHLRGGDHKKQEGSEKQHQRYAQRGVDAQQAAVEGRHLFQGEALLLGLPPQL